MNALVVGSNQEPLSHYLPRANFLLIDDELPDRLRARAFDVARHTFNPLTGLTPNRARDLAELFYAADPGGDATLTVRNGKRALAPMLVAAKRIDQLTGDRKDPAAAEALAMIDNILFSPTVRRVLTGSNFSLKGTILARLNRAELGDFDCYVLGNLLISQYQGQVVIPDFGFYAAPFHTSLIRQNRLIAGIRSFDEVPKFRNQLIQIEEKVGSRCTPEDAKLLAVYEGLVPGTNEYNDFIGRCIA